MKKKLSSMLALASMSMAYANVALATEGEGGGYGIVITDPDIDGLNTVAGTILGAMKFIGYVVAVVMMIYIGIKYLTAGAGKKAEVKDTLVPMLIGALLIIFGMTIVDWVWKLG